MANVILRVVLLRLRLNPIGIADGRDYLQRALRNERRKEVFDLFGVRIRFASLFRGQQASTLGLRVPVPDEALTMPSPFFSIA
jgi:hypothetical protein